MALDTLDVLGIHFTNVKGFRAKATTDVSDKSYLRPQGSETYTDNNTYDVTELSEVVVNVSGTASTIESLSVTPTTSQQTFNSASVDGYKPVVVEAMPSGTEGTPTATKGTVSSHSITVTPSVTNSAGYISGGTHTGTGATVSASELVSGTLNITAAGTTDVTNYENVSVSAMTLPSAASASSSGTSKATIGRSTSAQYINIPTGYNTTAQYYTISATPNGSVTAPSSISGTSATVSTGTNTLTLTKSVSVTPNVTTAGYISSGTAGNASVSLTASVTTKAAATITPTTSNQTIASGTYLTGTQTIAGDADLVAANIKAGVNIFNVAGTYTSDATATASDIVSGETAYVDGRMVEGTLTLQTYYTGSSAPSSSLGQDGDIYLQT